MSPTSVYIPIVDFVPTGGTNNSTDPHFIYFFVIFYYRNEPFCHET